MLGISSSGRNIVISEMVSDSIVKLIWCVLILVVFGLFLFCLM